MKSLATVDARMIREKTAYLSIFQTVVLTLAPVYARARLKTMLWRAPSFAAMTSATIHNREYYTNTGQQ